MIINHITFEKHNPMKKIILLLLVMASFNAFSQEKKGVAIDLCVDTSFHDPNFEYLNVTIRNNYEKDIKIMTGFEYRNFPNFYFQPKTCIVNETMYIKLSQYNNVDKDDNYECCNRKKFYYIEDLISNNYTKILKKNESYDSKFRVPKEQFSKAKEIQICINVDKAEQYRDEGRLFFDRVYEVTEFQHKCSSSKNILSKEKIKIELTEDKTRSDSSRVYLDFKITNITNKKIQLLADEGYKLIPQMIFGVYDTIVSDTLHFKLFHPKTQQDDVFLYNQENDSIPTSVAISDKKYLIKKEESITIHLVMSRAEFNSIKCIKMKWFDSFAMGKNDEFEERVLYFPTNLIK